ncbi:MAG: cysteine desulfurase family protein, partial [bacterium]|nr:cysteine desulfurase family protein [bacterium]
MLNIAKILKISKKRKYLDYASLTPISKGVQKETFKYMADSFANPSSIHKEGLFALRALNSSREKTAKSIKAHSDEIVFTASGTESNNLAILGLAEENLKQGIDYKNQHYITSAIEHSSVLGTFKALEKMGAKVSYITVNENGEIDLGLLKKSLNKDTVLVSVMMVNNETGVIEKIKDISKIIRDYNKANSNSNLNPNLNLNPNSKVLLHTDASQAFLYSDIDVSKTNIDLLTLDAHKVYGPRGVGMLYIKRDVKISPIIFGGGQEGNIRSGTENVPGIAGLAFALEEAEKNRKIESERILKIRNTFEE